MAALIVVLVVMSCFRSTGLYIVGPNNVWHFGNAYEFYISLSKSEGRRAQELLRTLKDAEMRKRYGQLSV